MIKKLKKYIRNEIAHAADQSVNRHKKDLTRQVNAESRTLYRQIASYIDLRGILGHSNPIPPLRGWAISPDLAVHLINHLDQKKPTRILELGSGFSTVLFARYSAENNATVVAIEHDKEYAEKTRSLVDSWGVGEYVDILYCPIMSYVVDEKEISYYNAEPLREFAPGFDFAFIDGPPKSLGETVRAGLFPVFGEFLAPKCKIVMDDYYRSGEQAVVEQWTSSGLTDLVYTDKTLEKYVAHLQKRGV